MGEIQFDGSGSDSDDRQESDDSSSGNPLLDWSVSVLRTIVSRGTGGSIQISKDVFSRSLQAVTFDVSSDDAEELSAPTILSRLSNVTAGDTWTYLRPILTTKRFAGRLAKFVYSPMKFIKDRLIMVLLGAIFGVVFKIADTFGTAFGAVETALSAVGTSLETAVTSPVDIVVAQSATLATNIETWTAGLGPLQPFVVFALWLVITAAFGYLAVRLLRAVMDSIPILSGLESLIFG